jgi:hypothetical protein
MNKTSKIFVAGGTGLVVNVFTKVQGEQSYDRH